MGMALKAKRWTLAEMHALPEDSNKYELIDGELFVSPAPSDLHGLIVARLNELLVPYVHKNRLGLVYAPRSVFRVKRRIEVEPDLMVRKPHPGPVRRWETAPIPSLVIEVASPGSRSYDLIKKRDVYMNNGIPEYWIVDDETRSIRAIRPDREDVVTITMMTWSPADAIKPLRFRVAKIFE